MNKKYYPIKYLLSSGNTYAALPLIWQGSSSLSWFKEATRAVRFWCISHWRAILEIVNRFFSWNKVKISKLYQCSITTFVCSERNTPLNKNILNVLNWRNKSTNRWLLKWRQCSSAILHNCQQIISQNLQNRSKRSNIINPQLLKEWS